jgi:D-aspartate ligase
VTTAPPDTSTPAVVLKLFHGGLAIARTLGRMGVRVHGVHADRRTPAATSRYLVGIEELDIDLAPPARALERLVALGRRLGGRPLLIAVEDAGAMFVADHAEELAATFRFPALPRGLARALSSKQGMAELCQLHGIPTAATAFPTSRANVERFAEETDFPVVLKGIDSNRLQQRKGIRVAFASDRDELLREYGRLETPTEPNLMLQEYIPGGITCGWMFNGYFDETSECLFGITGRKIRQYPPYTGFTTLGILVENAEIERVTREFMRTLGYRGVLDIGYRYDARDGRYKLLDVNPRVGTTFRLFVSRTGADVVRCLYLDLTGQQVPSDDARFGRKWLVENLDLSSSAVYFRNRELTPLQWVRSLRGVEEAAWFARDDLRPFGAMIRHSRPARRSR